MSEHDGVLGKQVPLPRTPQEAILERIFAPTDNLHSEIFITNSSGGLCTYKTRYIVRFSCPEFTSLCPVTGQPDFAHIVIDYMPKEHLIESKSLKLFLGSFRSHGEYHEVCTNYIGHRILVTALPFWIRVCGFWYPRGGIPIDIVWEAGELQGGAAPLPLDIKNYGGR